MAKIKDDLTGQKFGDLTVLNYAGKGKWLCECSCENHTLKEVYTTHLTGGYVKSCGHNNKESNKLKDLTGQKLGKLKVLNYEGNSRWLCECECGEKSIVRSYELRRGDITQCKKCADNSRREDWTGKTLYNWLIGEYLGDKKYRCTCLLCNRQFDVLISNIKRGSSKSCYECSVKDKLTDLIGKRFGTLTVTKYLDSSNWECQCDCGNTIVSNTHRLTNNITQCCDECYIPSTLIDMNGKVFGNWEVLGYAGGRKWKCKCQKCGTIKDVIGYNLRSGHSESCGCDSLIDLTGQQFNEWTALEYVGEGYWKCRCSCGTIKNVHGYELRSNSAFSCGCKKWAYARKTMLDKYGELSHYKFDNKRSTEQINAVENKENLEQFINDNFNKKPTIYRLSVKLGINTANTLKKIHKFNLEDKVEIDPSTSRWEDELYDIVSDIKDVHKLDITIERNKKGLTEKNQELDIYIPELKLAIEFDGSFWHSDKFRDKLYHQKKSLRCLLKGIRLVHIYEHDWVNKNKRDNIINELIKIITDTAIYNEEDDNNLIDISEITDSNKLVKLINEYNSSRIYIGYYYCGQLIGVGEFSKIDNSNEYILHNIAWIISGYNTNRNNKIIQYFIESYKPSKITHICNLDTENAVYYSKHYFQIEEIYEPGYVFVHRKLEKVITESKDEEKDGKYENNPDYLKIYNAGSIKYAWFNNSLESENKGLNSDLDF